MIEPNNLYCGIIMPISAMPGYTPEHWLEVKSIIVEATQKVEGFNFKTEIVSNSDGEIDVIHKRIIQNIYNADIIVCDMSGRNPNVMFELGMRLTFDKPTIIIKDDQTDFIFDTGVIEHLTYPKDLRYSKIGSFKHELSNRIKHTLVKSNNDPNYSTFLQNFGEFRKPSLNQTAVTDVQQLILDEVNTLRREINSFKKETAATKQKPSARVVPAGLQSVIYNYIKNENDFSNADVLIYKEEFINYLQSENYNPQAIGENILKKIVKDAQADVLPF
ncbi:hypothetical protein [Bacillus sp. FJAT-18017]|uniref:hypothetical protein n=1 Tax=Bacillus sp. FJAT-18017 TaxID=1705566 RepID=UPI0006AE4672|nr:hypothetical protein [Bacillus sp. FJAT-18017]